MGYGHVLSFVRGAIENAKRKAKSRQSSPTAIAPSSPPPLHYTCWQLPGWTAPRSPQRAKTANVMGGSSPRGGYVETSNVNRVNQGSNEKGNAKRVAIYKFQRGGSLVGETEQAELQTPPHGQLTATGPRAGAPIYNEKKPTSTSRYHPELFRPARPVQPHPKPHSVEQLAHLRRRRCR